MPISWNEIRHNAVAFAKDWAGATRENAERQTFWNEFFAVFGIKRRTVASFEEPVKNLGGNWDFIDLFWPGTLLVEHKSRGKSLEKAESQALQYIRALKDAGRDDEIPPYVLVSDFARIALHDLEGGEEVQFPLQDFHRNVNQFAFIPGYKQHKLDDEDPANFKAVALLGELHDALEAGGYTGHDLERFLGRVSPAVARRASHRSVRAQLRHTARQITASLPRGTPSGPPPRLAAGNAPAFR